MKLIIIDICPRHKPNAANNNQHHNGNVYNGICCIRSQRRIWRSNANQIKPRITKSRDRMEDCIPYSFHKSKITAKDRGQQDSSNHFNKNNRFEYEFCHTHNAPNLGSGYRFLHDTSLHQPNFSSGNYRNGNGNGHNTHTANLD